MDTPNLFGSLSIAALLASCWQQIRVLGAKLISLVFVRARVHHPVSVHVARYCYTNFRRSPFGLITIDGGHWFVRPLKRYQLVGFEKPGREPLVFWWGWRPILLSAMPANQTNGVSEGDTATITTIRGMVDIEHIIIASLENYNARAGGTLHEGRFRIRRFSGDRRGPNNGGLGSPHTEPAREVSNDDNQYRLLRWNEDQIGPERVTGKALDALAFPAEVQTLVDELTHWLESEAWYQQRGIPWRRGWLLYGRPGTGKTSLIRAIAQDLDLPVCVFDIGTMCNTELQFYWREALNNAPCIALIEDIDAVFEGRKNMLGEQGGGLTFDCLLNCLSGIETANGVFLVITTNRVELLDEAIGAPRQGQNGTMISTRPGRVDRALELVAMSEHCRRQLAERILSGLP